VNDFVGHDPRERARELERMPRGHLVLAVAERPPDAGVENEDAPLSAALSEGHGHGVGGNYEATFVGQHHRVHTRFGDLPKILVLHRRVKTDGQTAL